MPNEEARLLEKHRDPQKGRLGQSWESRRFSVRFGCRALAHRI